MEPNAAKLKRKHSAANAILFALEPLSVNERAEVMAICSTALGADAVKPGVLKGFLAKRGLLKQATTPAPCPECAETPKAGAYE